VTGVTAADATGAWGRPPHGPVRRVLAISSGGGHWTELTRLAPALAGHAVTWVTTDPGYRDARPPGDFYVVADASMWDKLRLVTAFAQIVRIVVGVRPEYVVSTGAAPGFLAMVIGKLLGARTLWVDSIANAGELSLSGRRVGPWADLWLTQWEHLARPEGPEYRGSVL
jgi:UDP-N-acetylglucosamine:LPS N-acetylglucosamine transferase